VHVSKRSGLPRTRAAGTALITVLFLACSSIVWSQPATASITSDRVQIAALEQQIAAQGAHAKALLSRYNVVQSHVHTLNLQIARDQDLLAADLRSEAVARMAVRRVAVDAYLIGADVGSPALALFSDTTSVTSILAQGNYLGAVNQNLNDALATLQSARQQTEKDARSLRSEQAEATRLLDQLSTAHRAAEAAIASDNATLQRVNVDLRFLVVAAAQRQAAQLAAERLLAALPSPLADPAHLVGVPRARPVPPPSPGMYANPLRDIRGLTAERIDQGVDYSGFGPLYAIGDGVVLTTTVPGWPGGTMIAYQLTDGPANGLVVYAAEDIVPLVQIGDTVTAGTVLGVMFPGPDGIETGWGDTSTIGNTLARTYRQFDGANTTAFGDNFSQLLQSLGAPGGVPQNTPPTGSLPRRWPRWHPSRAAPGP